MPFSAIRVEIADGLGQLIFANPARGNPVDGAFCSEMNEAANCLSETPGLRCLLISAEGESFSFGGDVRAFLADLPGLPVNIKRWTTTLHSAIARLQRMDAPIVSAVQGICAGGMAGIVAGSDIVVAADNVRFVAAYAAIGYSCDAGSSVMFGRRMGLGRARKFLLLNETLTAQEALVVGLADEVVPADQLSVRAHAIARKLALGPTLAYGEMRRLMLSSKDQPLETQLELEAQSLARIAATADAREGLEAFAAKRTPVFWGK